VCPHARRASDFLLLATVETSRGKLSNSCSRVGSRGDVIEDVATLSTWECGSHLDGPQKFEVYLYPTKSEYEVEKVTRIYQGLQVGSALSPRKGKCGCRRVESQGSLQLLASCMFFRKGIYHPSVTRNISVQHHPNTDFKE
jgi:hypothetical protein